MRLLLAGANGSHTCDWAGYALVRDNVQHFVEGGAPTQRFAALHRIEKAIDDGSCVVDAARLRGEVLRAWYALSRISLARAAVSLRTRAILTRSREFPNVRGTVSAREVRWELPVPAVADRQIAESARPFIAAVLALTEKAVDGVPLGVVRRGEPPRFVKQG